MSVWPLRPVVWPCCALCGRCVASRQGARHVGALAVLRFIAYRPDLPWAWLGPGALACRARSLGSVQCARGPQGRYYLSTALTQDSAGVGRRARAPRASLRACTMFIYHYSACLTLRRQTEMQTPSD